MTPSGVLNKLFVPDAVDLRVIPIFFHSLFPKPEAYNAACEPLIIMLFTHIGSTTL